MRISDILRDKGGVVHTITPLHTVKAAVDELVARNIGSLLVTEQQQAVGIITERDILRLCSHDAHALGMIRVRDAMSSPVLTCAPGDSVDDAMELMTRRRVRHLPVLDDGRIAGMISIGDLVKAQLAEQSALVANLQEYIAGPMR